MRGIERGGGVNGKNLFIMPPPVAPRMRVTLCTVASSAPTGDSASASDTSLAVMMAYAHRWRYDFLYYVNEGRVLSFRGRHPAWSKVVAIVHALFVRSSDPDTFVFYLDPDAIVYDVGQPVERFFPLSVEKHQSKLPKPRTTVAEYAAVMWDNSPYQYMPTFASGHRQ